MANRLDEVRYALVGDLIDLVEVVAHERGGGVDATAGDEAAEAVVETLVELVSALIAAAPCPHGGAFCDGERAQGGA